MTIIEFDSREQREILINPYAADDSAGSDIFVGREWVFEWLRKAMAEETAVPLLLYGEARIGKSATVRRIRQGILGESVLPVTVMLKEFTQIGHFASLESWLLTLSRLIADTLRTTSTLVMPTVDAAAFAENPSLAFRQQLLDPIMEQLDGRNLLLVFDDAEVLLQSPTGNEFFRFLEEMLPHYSAVYVLLTARIAPEALAQKYALEAFRHKRLGPLNSQAAAALISEHVPFHLFRDVTGYILEVTRRHPFYLQRLLHMLYERWRERNLSQVTLTDVIAVVRSQAYRELRPPRRAGDVSLAQAQRSFALAQTEYIIPERSLTWRRPLLFATLLLAFVFLIAFSPPLVNWLRGAEEEAGSVPIVAIITATAEPTAVPTSTPLPTQPLPTDTPVIVILSPTPEPTLPPTVTPLPQPTEELVEAARERVREKDGMPMVFVPSGTYPRGSDAADPNADPDETPQRDVTIDAFYIDKYEVSVAQYAAFLSDVGDHRSSCGGGVDCARTSAETDGGTYLLENQERPDPYFAQNNFGNFPINYVSWPGARDYCNWAGGRLPTEAEWEYAARGTDGRIYPWGNEPPDRSKAVFESDFRSLLAVDTLPDGASPFGALSMAGSMWEWVGDWYDAEYYAWGPDTNPPGPPQGTERVARGGAWVIDNTAARIRAANRNSFRPAAMRADVGFRCAFDVPES